MIERINKIKKYDPRLRSEMKLLAYERENAWWYHFFQAAGSSSYDAEYANSLRIDGISPEKAAEESLI